MITDRQKARAAVTANGWALSNLSPELRADPAIVRAAVTQNGIALQFADDARRDDFGTVWLAVTQAGGALVHASHRLRGDAALTSIAVRQDADALQACLCHRGWVDHEFYISGTDRAGVRYATLRDDVDPYRWRFLSTEQPIPLLEAVVRFGPRSPTHRAERFKQVMRCMDALKKRNIEP